MTIAIRRDMKNTLKQKSDMFWDASAERIIGVILSGELFKHLTRL